MPTDPKVFCQLTYDSTDNQAKFGHDKHDDLEADDGWTDVAAVQQAAALSKGFEFFHLHNAAGRGGTGPQYQGQWSAATSYTEGQFVEVSGGTYLFRKSTTGSNKGNDPMSHASWVTDTGVTWDGSTDYNTYTAYANNQIVRIPRTVFKCRSAVTGGALFANTQVWERSDGLSMVVDAFIKRRSDAPYMVAGFRKAWAAFAAQYETRHYFGCQWKNTRVNKHIGVDKGPWSSGIDYVLRDKVTFANQTWQANTAHTSSGSNDPLSSAFWDLIDADYARATGAPRHDRYFRRLWDSVELPLGAGMGLAFDDSGGTPADDPSMPLLRCWHENGIKITTEASPLLGYTHLFDFDTMITSQFLPTVELGSFAEPLANLNGDVSIYCQSEPGYGKTHTGAWSASSVSYSATGAVSHGGFHYWSKQAHTSSGANEPGTGGGAAFWDLVLPEYYYIPNATFSNSENWLAEYIETFFDKSYSLVFPYYLSAFDGGATLEDYLPPGYISP